MGSGGSVLENDPGIIPRVMEQIFKLKNERSDTTTEITVSFMELYMEELRDLLAPPTLEESKRPIVSIRENYQGEVEVTGVTEKSVHSLVEMGNCLSLGSRNRTTSSTKMNDESSRSHAIFTISIEHNHGDDMVTTSKFHLVDLAGSERAKRTGAEGQQFDEGVTINQSLFALGNVISALGDDTKRAAGHHVPYRDSKLTRLLQNSLGGNSRTMMIACVSPANDSVEETQNTLKYANRARNIKNKVVKNVDPHKAQLAALRNQMLSMQQELLQLKEGTGKTLVESDQAYEIQTLRDQLEMAHKQAQSYQDECAKAEAEKAQLELMLEQHGVSNNMKDGGLTLILGLIVWCRGG